MMILFYKKFRFYPPNYIKHYILTVITDKIYPILLKIRHIRDMMAIVPEGRLYSAAI